MPDLPILGVKRAKETRFLLFFAITVLLFSILFEFAAHCLGAFVSPSQMADAQQVNSNLVVNLPDLIFFGALKMRCVAKVQPEIVLIGSSHFSEMRSRMFRPYRFYNACLTAWTFDQLYRTLDIVTSVAHPRVVIFTMDYSMFGSQQEAEFGKRIFDLNEGWVWRRTCVVSILSACLGDMKKFAGDLPNLLAEHNLDPFDHMELLGFTAKRYGAGFRHDGSVLFQRGYIANSQETNRHPNLAGQAGGPGVEAQQLEALKRLKELADQRNVILVGIQAPIFKGAVELLDAAAAEYFGVWQEFETPEFRERIREMGIVFFDLARAPQMADSQNFTDPYHPNERCLLESIIQLSEDPRFMSIFSELDVAGLREDLSKAREANEYYDIYHGNF